jgi:transcriptional regulator with XRE-family HTH domain
MAKVTTVEPDGPKIKALRERAGLTQADLARLTGRHPQTIAAIEHSNKVFSLRLIAQLAHVLGKEPEELITAAAKAAVKRAAKGAIKPAVKAA